MRLHSSASLHQGGREMSMAKHRQGAATAAAAAAAAAVLRAPGKVTAQD